MLNTIYGWIRNLACYLVIVTVVMEVIPGSGYKKYIRFFTGLVMLLLLMTPVLRLTGMNKEFTALYHGYEYEQVKKELEEQKMYLQEDILDFLPEEYPETDAQIKVEEVKIGE